MHGIFLKNFKKKYQKKNLPGRACRLVCVCARNQRHEPQRGAYTKLPPVLRNVARILIWPDHYLLKRILSLPRHYLQ